MHDDLSLDEARRILADQLNEGLHCPCCGQYARIYKRKLNATMVKALSLIYKATAPGLHFAHGPTVLRGSGVFGGDLGKLAYFGLVEEEKSLREDGGRSGWWRVTPKGRAFLRGLTHVPKYVHVYNGTVHEFSGEPIGVHDVAPRFDYRELMSA